MMTSLFVAIVGTAFSAGGQESGDQESAAGDQAEAVEITVLLSDSELGRGVPEMFAEKYPNVKVNASNHSWEKLGAMVTSGNYPAVTAMTQTRVARFAALGVITPIDSLIEEYGSFDESDFLPVERQWLLNDEFLPADDGKRYGISKDWNLTEDYFYREDLFEEAGTPLPEPREPVTYEDFRENVLEKLAVREGGTTRRWPIDGYLFADTAVALRTLLHTAGSDIFNEDLTRVEISSNSEAKEVLRFILDLQKDRLAPSVIDPAPAWAMPLFTNTKEDPLAIFQWGQWGLSALLEEPSEFIQKVGFAEGPVWSTEVDSQAFHPSVGYSIGTGLSPAQEKAAWDFLEFITYGEWGRHRAEMGWGLPPFKSLMDLVPRDNELANQMWQVSMDEIENQKFEVLGWPPYALFPVDSALNKHSGAYLRGEISFSRLIERIETEANEALRRGRMKMAE